MIGDFYETMWQHEHFLVAWISKRKIPISEKPCSSVIFIIGAIRGHPAHTIINSMAKAM